METLVLSPATQLAPAAPPWTLQYLPRVDSTNLRAAALPAWSAVLAGAQTAGRGRNGRSWISDSGGVWLSAVVPCPEPRARWAVLPLVAGWALIRSLQELGVAGPRLRWPNDVMVARRKLAGILVERFSSETAVIGIGLNVFNSPEDFDASLAGSTVRLADLVMLRCSLLDVSEAVLGSIRQAYAVLSGGGFSGIVADLNRSWTPASRVTLQLHGGNTLIEGEFLGIDEQGRVRVEASDSGVCVYDASQVQQLRELDGSSGDAAHLV